MMGQARGNEEKSLFRFYNTNGKKEQMKGLVTKRDKRE